jgi:hypothetical protein
LFDWCSFTQILLLLDAAPAPRNAFAAQHNASQQFWTGYSLDPTMLSQDPISLVASTSLSQSFARPIPTNAFSKKPADGPQSQQMLSQIPGGGMSGFASQGPNSQAMFSQGLSQSDRLLNLDFMDDYKSQADPYALSQDFSSMSIQSQGGFTQF